MKITHIFPHTYNIGDYFVQLGILKFLREFAGNFDYISLPSSVSNPKAKNGLAGITSSTLSYLNQSDLVVIGGSNMYEVLDGDLRLLDIADEINRLEKPILLIGIGSGWSFKYPSFPFLPQKALGKINLLHSKSCGSSVRDNLTLRMLQVNGISSAVVTGCPAAFIHNHDLRSINHNKVVGITLLPARMVYETQFDPRKWNSEVNLRKKAITVFFLKLVEALRILGYFLKIIVHDYRDIPIAKRILGDDFFYSDQPESVLAEISTCDVIIGFRLHSVIAALGMGIPGIPILADGRSAAFTETFGLTEHAVNPFDPSAIRLTMEQVDLALTPNGRNYWLPALERRDFYLQAMREFISTSLLRAGLSSQVDIRL